jgi:hypothetical protein
MKAAVLAGLMLAVATRSPGGEPPRFSLSGAAGAQLGGSSEAVHLAAGFGYSPKPCFTLGADIGYSYLPLAANARGGGNRAYFGLLTLSATAWPSGTVSPYLVLGYGLGHYDASWTDAESGRALSFGTGLQLRVRPRVRLFVETRLAMIGGISAADGLHIEAPIRVGIRLGF